MARYYFHIRDHDGLIVDDMGSEFESLHEAHQEAIRLAKCLADDMREIGDIVDGQTIELTAKSGAIFEVVPLQNMGAFRTSSYARSANWMSTLLGL